jgi:predicted secreted protein
LSYLAAIKPSNAIDMPTLKPLILIGLLTLAAPAIQAAESGATQLTLSGRAQQELDNDQVTARLYVQENRSNAAQLADSLNRSLKRGLTDAKQLKGVEISGGQVRTWPQYDRNGRISGWQGRGELTIRGKQSTEFAEMVGRLQNYMQVEDIQFSLSDATRHTAEAQLIGAAIRDLQARAAEVAKSLAKPHLTIRELNLNDQPNPSWPPRPVMMKAAAAPMAGEVTPPSWETGKSTISVEISGKVELQ